MKNLPLISPVIKTIKAFCDRSKLASYDNETLVEYFRKQGARIGEGCHFQIRNIGNDPYLIRIGNHVFIATGVVLHTHDGGVWILRESIPGIRICGPITIEDNCVVGINSQILPNVRIGENSIIGAGSVVLSDIPPNSIAMGVPARVVGSTVRYKERSISSWEEQKPAGVSEFDYGWWYSSTNRKLLKQHLLKLFDSKQSIKQNAE